LVLLFFSAWKIQAAPVSLEDAEKCALNWFLERQPASGVVTARVFKPLHPVVPEIDLDGAFHVVNLEPSGYALVASDDVAAPILFYAPSGRYTGANLPPQFKEMLQGAVREVRAAIASGVQPSRNTTDQWARLRSSRPARGGSDALREVAPLLGTTWDQGTYYNALCPVDAAGPGGRVWAGCVATAMAQIMKYHGYPAQGKGAHTYYHPVYGSLSANFGTTTYNWGAMPDSLSSASSSSEVTEVARLLFQCGVAVEMDYAPDGSGAYDEDARNALVQYFGYSANAAVISRSNYSSSVWLSFLKADLDKGQPIFYSGANSEGGHAFVLDGYQGTDYFHVNWGWSGYYDGYYYLNDLTPVAFSEGFNEYQCAIISLRPQGGYGLSVLVAPAEAVAAGCTATKSPDAASYATGTVVTLSAKTVSGFTFVGWFDGATMVSGNVSYRYTVANTDKTFTARFKSVSGPTYSLTLVADPANGGTGTKDPNQAAYEAGDGISVSAVAASGFIFHGWVDGATTISTTASFLYTMPAVDKVLTAKYKSVRYTVSVAADPVQGGAVSKLPNKATYAMGEKVILTAVAASGFSFAGWFDGAKKIAEDATFLYTVKPLDKTFTARFEVYTGPPTPVVTATGNNYRVLLSWEAVTSATTHEIERTVAGTTDSVPVAWRVGAVTEFADDVAVPGILYSYRVMALDTEGLQSKPSLPVTGAVTAESFAPASYKVTAKGYTMEQSVSIAGSLTFTPTLPGGAAGTIKITRLQKLPAYVASDPAKGVYYLLNRTQIPLLTVAGDVKTLAFDIPVRSLEVTGTVSALQAKTWGISIRAGGLVSAKLAATRPMKAEQYARVFVETNGSVPLTLQTTGAVVESLSPASGSGQPVKRLCVASKVYKEDSFTWTSLGAVGSLPRVLAEVADAEIPQSEATPCSIRGSALKSVSVSGGPLVADEMIGLIDKVTVAGGNLRCRLIQSGKDLALLQATAQKVNGILLVGGAIGTAGQPGAMVVQAQPGGTGMAIAKVYGQRGISGVFYAGYDATIQQGGIGVLQTKAPGVVEGQAFLNPALVAKMKVLPKVPTQPIAINPDLP
jgi:hypothetical protein